MIETATYDELAPVLEPRDARLRPVCIAGVGHALPDTELTSAEMEERLRQASARCRLPAGFIERVSTVASRRYRAPGQECSDLATAAGNMALERAGIGAGDVDALVFAAASQDVAEPATSNIIVDKLGCGNAWALDVKNACNSFLNGLDVAHSIVQTGRAQTVLVTNGEVLSGVVDWSIEGPQDVVKKFAGLTLGDGGAAAVVTSAGTGTGRMYPATFLTDGASWDTSVVWAGGSVAQGDPSRAPYFQCDGVALGRLASRYIPGIVQEALARAGWEPESVSAVVPHQVAPQFFDLLERIGFRRESVVVTLDRYGNMAAAGIPIALSLAVEEGRIQRGDRVLLVCGAGGFSGGAIPLEW